MRKRFEAQNMLDGLAISDVEIDTKSRHQLPQLLVGLQYIFVTEGLNEEIFGILEKCILKNKKETGRLGMSLWEIFVLGCTRLNMNMDYDSLQDHSNNHKSLRRILGVGNKNVFAAGKYYNLQTLKDNVGLLDEETLKQINTVKVGRKTSAQQVEESEKSFKLNLNKHSAIESNINELEHCGADLVRDKGFPNFKKYIGWSALSYNIKKLGKVVIKQELLPWVHQNEPLIQKRV